MSSIFISNLLFVFATVLPILNPPGVAPIFWTMTSGANAATRKMLSKRIAVNVFIMVVAAIFLGNFVLTMLGISLSVVRVGGGLLVIAAAWKLLNAEDPDTSLHPMNSEEYTVDKAKNNAFYPLTFPITCGPGTIAAAITVGASLQINSINTDTFAILSGTILGVLGVALTVYLCLRFAAQFLHRLGRNGTTIFMRLSAFILLCIGVQILWAGIHDLVISLYTDVAKIK
ncbi:MarC family protein [Pelistega sp. MC2]|uniref:MarC family protein n=1 Tax=Pelistega sp. MC2 TaxID=1720297 RepID=UPI0008DA4E56|nr:MarC family protein [Pelistega sp. MC2]